MDTAQIKKGDRYRVSVAFAVHVLTMWKAPFTSGYERTLPVGLAFIIDNDPYPKSTGVSALPDPYGKWELELVSQTDLSEEKYNGYYFVVSYDQLQNNCAHC